MSSSPSPKPSSSTSGFFQNPPVLRNAFDSDPTLQRIASLYLPNSLRTTVSRDLSQFGSYVLSRQVHAWTANAETHSPYLQTWDTFGQRKDELVTSEGWRALKAVGIREGMHVPAEEHGSVGRVVMFLKYHIWTPACAFVTCPSAMTDGAACLLARHLESPSLPASLRSILAPAHARLSSRDPATAWTSGQWMTERPGGSDVSRTETVATLASDSSSAGQPSYSVSGFKWFSSATDSDMAILLARTPNSPSLSVFYAPMRLSTSPALNGVRIQRLKSKLGTRALPTAELELVDLKAWMIGKEGEGVREISTILNVTRVHTAMTALGLWGRGIAVAKAWGEVRKVGGRELKGVRGWVGTMAGVVVGYWGWMQVTFFAVMLLGISERGLRGLQSKNESLDRILPASYEDVKMLLRLLTPVVKAMAAKKAIEGLSECMEALGGVGYLENGDVEFNIARLLRDASVLSIWEGTTDVLGLDLVKVLKGRQGEEALRVLGLWMGKAVPNDEELTKRWRAWEERVKRKSVQELEGETRVVMKELGDIMVTVLLVVDAERDGDAIACEVARRWCGGDEGVSSWQERGSWDGRILYGDNLNTSSSKL